MRRYEMMIIVTDTLEEEAAVAAFDRAKDILAQQGGTLLDEAWWGRRKLAYEINKRDFGYYGVLDFEGTSEAVAELERLLKISDDIVRFKTVRPEIRVRASA
ncbi:30S ribosomal protein S6 [Egicoccus halophilus]|uniref:Small ribosomal subunit protein bS6 n=1 Tax=Egicoccus halophilus TaxID=1670830 RepID=A0A8J3EQS7_9ACTN|nr:30S ribosomal protein S6 [Egicoccus halophilus]GGI03259.1 30S ribosomal protein S6 [Egicoccus halophilus]